MINTATNISPVKLEIYKINFNNLFTNSLADMVNFLSTYDSCFPSTDITNIKPAIGLSFKEQKILIDTKKNDEKLIAKCVQKVSYLDSGKTIAEWADEILMRYLNWLKRQYNKQRRLLKNPIDYYGLATIIKDQPTTLLFDLKAYLHNVANNLDDVSCNILYILSFAELSTIDQTYFYTEILNKLTNMDIITSSNILSLVDLINKQDNNSTICIAILRLLQNIVNQQAVTKVKYDVKDSNSSTVSLEIAKCIKEKNSQI